MRVDVRTFSSHEVCEMTGASFRQLDYWHRCGHIAPTQLDRHGRPVTEWGYGNARRWTLEDVVVVAVIVKLRNAGIGFAALDEAIIRLRDDSLLSTLDVPTSEESVTLTVDVAAIRDELCVRVAC